MAKKAAPAMPNQAASQARPGKKKSTPMGLKLTFLLAALPMAYVVYPTLILLGATMAPTVVAYLFDRSRARYLTITIGLLNGCGSLPAIVRLWQLEQSQSVAFYVLGDLSTWLESYGAAGVGYLVYLGMSPIVSYYYAVTTSGRVHILRRKQRALIKEWGPEVADGTDEEFADEVGAEEPDAEETAQDGAEAAA